MSQKFIKKGELQLINGGYLVDANENPVTNVAFIAAQIRAEFIVKFAEATKGQDFEGKKPADLEEIRSNVLKALTQTQQTEFFKAPEKPQTDTLDTLVKDALAFITHSEETDKTSQLNAFMQEFNIIHEFEEFGLFFVPGIVKLNSIYTIDDIKKALNEASMIVK